MKPYICEDCGAVFDGGIRSQFCPACKVKRRNEASAKYNLKRKEETAKRRAEREAAKAAGKTVDEKPKVDPDDDTPEWLTHPDRAQCKKCIFARYLHSQSSGELYCNFLEIMNQRREHDGTVCLSRIEEK